MTTQILSVELTNDDEWSGTMTKQSQWDASRMYQKKVTAYDHHRVVQRSLLG